MGQNSLAMSSCQPTMIAILTLGPSSWLCIPGVTALNKKTPAGKKHATAVAGFICSPTFAAPTTIPTRAEVKLPSRTFWMHSPSPNPITESIRAKCIWPVFLEGAHDDADGEPTSGALDSGQAPGWESVIWLNGT